MYYTLHSVRACRHEFIVILTLAAAVFSFAQQNRSVYQNPIIPGFNPDPSICRVADDYYLVTSTFEYFPGVPIYHSRDLVHWKMIGHALHRPSQLNLDTIRCSAGIYAPTLRYDKGTFYMITTLVGSGNEHHNFIVTARTPEGPWSDPQWIEGAQGIDPSLFFDTDGKVYYSGNCLPQTRLWDKHRNIWIQELDLKTWKLVGRKVDVLDGGEYYRKGTLDGGIESGVNNFEASHIYKKDGTYYLLIAHGGTSQNHAVSIWKSDNVFGPYEINPANPILTHRDLSREYTFTSTGHADLVQTQHGEWWMVYLAKRPYGGENHILGRETFMSPVDWSGTWPVVNAQGNIGRGEILHPRPSLKVFTFKPEGRRDEFTTPVLGKAWTFIRTPRSEWWSLTKRKGFLRIALRPEMIAEQLNPSFIGKRQEHIDFSATVKMEFIAKSENEEAGLVVERDKDYYLRYTVGLENGQHVLRLFRKQGGAAKDSLMGRAVVDQRMQYLKVSSEGYRYDFEFSRDGQEWETLFERADGRVLGLAGAGRFTGTMVGMYASSNGAVSTNCADFDWFQYEDRRTHVRLPRFFRDGMVLQRNIQIPLWGWAPAGEMVRVAFLGRKYTAKAGDNGKWRVTMRPANAGGPFQMRIQGNNTVTINDILIGDVWFCSGQSNMEFEMSKAREKYAKEIDASGNTHIRQFLVKRRISFNPLDDVESEAGWQSANPGSLLQFTAVGYFFAKDLYDKYRVPIGLISCSYGGTPAEAWMSEHALKDFPAYYTKALEYKDTAKVSRISLRDRQFVEAWYAHINQNDSGMVQRWSSPDYNAARWSTMRLPNYWQDQGLKDVEGGVVWFKKEFDVLPALAGKNATLWLGNISTRDSAFINGIPVGSTTSKYTPRKYAVDGAAIKEGRNTLTVRVLNENGDGGFIKDKPYRLELDGTSIDLEGVWKYRLGVQTRPLLREDVTRFQGQPTSMYYGMLSPMIGYGIKGVLWYQGESNVSRAREYRTLFPTLINSWRSEWKQGSFPFLFVQLANINAPKSEPAESKLAELQEAQSLALSLPNTGMVVANDIGEWNDVHPLNKSDVGLRLSLAAQTIAYGETDVVSSGPLYHSMRIDGSRIVITLTHVGSGLVAKGGGALNYFSIADSSKNFVWAKAAIAGNTIIVWNDTITKPVAVRYAWADNPVGANLYNKEGLPASCFRTDRE